MRRIPVAATLVVAVVVALLIGLGVWQLHRARQKDAMIARFSAAATLPPVGFPRNPKDQTLLFRRSSAFCLQPTGWRASAGRDRQGRPGYRHVADCRTGAEGPGIAVDMGWSTDPAAPRGWTGGAVTGTIGPDHDAQILLVSDTPAPSLAPSARPDVRDVPNNSFAYAIQWFLFAAVALLIYAIVLWRGRGGPPAPKG